jgi:hypothetical protein
MKRILLLTLIIMCIFTGIGYTTETIKISELGEASSSTADDYFVLVDDPGGSPVTKKIVASDLFGNLPNLGVTGCGTGVAYSTADTFSCETTLSAIVYGGFTASRMAESDASGNLTTADTATTGTGAPVKATSPTLVTPTLGVATVTSMEIGNADTSLTRVAAGIAAIEGNIIGGALTPTAPDDADDFDDVFTGVNLYGGTFLVNAAGSILLPNATAGVNFTILLEDAVATIIEPLATGTDDTIVLNGTALTQGASIQSSTKGAMCVFQYRAADSWMATCNGFIVTP